MNHPQQHDHHNLHGGGGPVDGGEDIGDNLRISDESREDSDEFSLFPDLSNTANTTTTGIDSSKSDSTLQVPIDTERVDAILAREMAELTMRDRETIQKSIYGVAPPVNESEESIARGLTQFDEILSAREKEANANPSSSLAGRMAAYLQAKQMNPAVTADRKLRLSFLRSSVWDFKEAERRIFLFFTKKLNFFGEAKLTRLIVWDDLSTREKALVRSGTMSWLPERDVSGRRVMVMIPTAIHLAESQLAEVETDHHKVIRSRLRAWNYIWRELVSDETCHLMGVVIVILAYGDLSILKDFRYIQETHASKDSGPFRISALHFCYHNPYIRPFITFNRWLMGKDVRARNITHYSSDMNQVMQELETYGIPTSCMPKLLFDKLTGDTTLSLEHHQAHIDRRIEQDSLQDPEETISVPHRFDVLFGKGGASIKHTGNMRCLHIIEMQRTAYDSASKYRRSEIAERVVSLIHESGGRFLKPVKGGWQEVENDVAKNKISHYFRRVRADENKKQSRNPVAVRSREDEVESLGGNQEKRSRK